MSPKSHSTDSRTVLVEELKACMAGVRTAFLKGAWPEDAQRVDRVTVKAHGLTSWRKCMPLQIIEQARIC